jgi:hypothetical protein
MRRDRDSQLRAWLHQVIDDAIAMLDDLDAATEDLEDDEIEDAEFDPGRRAA